LIRLKLAIHKLPLLLEFHILIFLHEFVDHCIFVFNIPITKQLQNSGGKRWVLLLIELALGEAFELVLV